MKILSGLQGRQDPASNAVSVDVGGRSVARSERSYHPVAADKNCDGYEFQNSGK